MSDSLRKWQKEAIQKYLQVKSQGRNSILWEATPGAGKTFAAMHVCKHEVRKFGAKKIVVVVPTTHLKLQWAKAAAGLGFHLDINFGDKHRALAKDYHGAILSYQQIGNNPKSFRFLATDAVVILDEVHHAGDGLTWGSSLKVAFHNSSFLLCLSGTAFRSDNNPIPFVRYSPVGISEPDYTYSYASAVSDRVCRPTVFLTYGGEVAWQESGVDVNTSFSDALERTGRTKRLRAALDPESGWIEPMIRDADEMLSALRQEHPEAGGLLVASSQKHARALSKILRQVTGESPVTVLSEDPTANTKLKKYTVSRERWLVACNMVSEGVDVPRLRIGVFATTIRTKMYFRQFLGRIVRKTKRPSGVQTSFFYLPADPWLKRLAEEIEEEQKHCIQVRAEDEFAPFPLEPRKDKEVETTWRALKSTNSGLEGMISGGGQLSLWGPSEESYGESYEESLSSGQIPNPSAGVLDDRCLTKAELKDEIAKDIRSLVAKYHKNSGRPHAYIHGLLNQKQGLKNQHECTETQLRERLNILESLVRSGTN